MSTLVAPAILVLLMLLLQFQHAPELPLWLLPLAAIAYLPVVISHEGSHWLAARLRGVQGQISWCKRGPKSWRWAPHFHAQAGAPISMGARRMILAAGPWSDAFWVAATTTLTLQFANAWLQVLWVAPALMFASNLLPFGSTDAAQLLQGRAGNWHPRCLLGIFFISVILVLTTVSLGIARAIWPHF